MINFLNKIFGCSHIYGMVQKDGYQYCEYCGKAILAPRFETCLHKWENIDTFSSTNRLSGNVYKITYVLKCVHCGEIRKEQL